MTAFVIFAFASQVLLVAFFAARRWQPARAPLLGRLVYGLGLVAAVLSLYLLIDRHDWLIAAAPLPYAAWSALGWVLDVRRPVEWRQPVRWSILVPYVGLLVGALVALWVPLWWVGFEAWLAFGLLFAVQTILNIAGHVGGSAARSTGASAGLAR
jgi:hypothetical protein